MSELMLLGALVVAGGVTTGLPNLAVNGDFEQGEAAQPPGWDTFFFVRGRDGQEKRALAVPQGAGSCVRIENQAGVGGTRAACIEMDRGVAEGYGQGLFSKPIPVEGATEYEVSAAVKSDGPNAILFVKGFAKVNGKFREVYTKHKEAHFDRYLKKGPYTTMTFRFRPRHVSYPVDHVKVWLYAYLTPGRVWFDQVRVTKVGAATADPMPGQPERKAPPPRPADPHPPIYIKK